ncbi:MAG TPA: lamin tail domain-containing protein, partial [Verrucomicrobiae bacterium]|nr:lamin tail domain-containing protein [Verrucomicrobiae bacterium]
GGAASPETRIAYAHFDGNSATAIHSADGTLFLDHLTFGNPAVQYLSLDRSSFVVQDCVFPATTASFEPTHGTGGIKAGGRGIYRRNFLGKVIGYNDAFDFTGGNRPGSILQVINNVFMGSDDDLLDLDSTDAWIEGNIFLHCHRNGSPDSSSAISGGADNADTSQITAVGNLFYDVDQAANAKQGNFYTLVNNTIVHQSKIGSQDTNTAVVILADDGTVQGAGMYLEGNIILDAENLTRNVTTALVTFTNNIIYQLAGAPWAGPGGNNVNSDPLLTQIPPFSVTSNFTSWAAAQVMWEYFSLRAGSPAFGTGPNGRDKGGVAVSGSGFRVPGSGNSELGTLNSELHGPLRGASISGEPVGATRSTTATLRVGLNRTGSGIPTAGFPDGSGFTHYRWRLDGGAWSAETPVATPITLSSLSIGPHYVEVSGKNDAGYYQDDPVFGSDASVTVSRTWTVNPAASTLRLNEILASNGGAVNYFGTTPDIVELHNASDSAMDLAGVRITDDLTAPDKFIFPAGASIPARGYLAVYADSAGTPGYHLRYNLPQGGGQLHLFASALEGGALLDSISFGLQITDLSIGRLADGSWALTQPTFGVANRPAPMGDSRALRINEWLALGDGLLADDFIELYNPQSLPVALGGLYLSDEPTGWPDRHSIAALSFTPGFGYQRFIADGDKSAGADHLDFHLNGDQGMIALSAPDLAVIDCVAYTPQSPGVSQGRSPNGTTTLAFFSTPTPGAPNPLLVTTPVGGALVLNEVLAQNASLGEIITGTNVVTPDWIELYNGSSNPTNLSGLSLTDNSTQPRKFVFAEGTILAPGGFLRIVCDTDSTSTNALVNTNFNIRANGGAVYLF